jgi:hypothetical protein
MSELTSLPPIEHPAAGIDVEIADISPATVDDNHIDVDHASATGITQQDQNKEHVKDVVKYCKQPNLLDQIAALKAEQKEMRTKKKQLSQTLRNAERRRTRLRKKAKLLSDNDLLDVLRMRGSDPVQVGSDES